MVPLLNLNAGHLNAFYADLLVDGRRTGPGGLSPTSVRRIHATVHKALADAVRWGRLPRNPADQADPPRASTGEMHVWTPQQLGAFIDYVRADRLFAAWLLAATTGMRRGELVGLRWSDVELEAGLVKVRQIRTVARYQVLTLTPKTDKGRRDVALDGQTIAALQSYRRVSWKSASSWGPATRTPRIWSSHTLMALPSTQSASLPGSNNTASSPGCRRFASTMSDTRTSRPCSRRACL